MPYRRSNSGWAISALPSQSSALVPTGGLRRGQEIEGWGDGICLLGEWGFFDDPTPRLDNIRWMRRIPLLARALRIYHFQLGTAAG
jgi:hypothetical protein